MIVCLQLQTADNTATKENIMYLGGFSTPTKHMRGGKWASRLASNIFQFVVEGDDDNFSIITSKAKISLFQLWQSEAWSQNVWGSQKQKPDSIWNLHFSL